MKRRSSALILAAAQVAALGVTATPSTAAAGSLPPSEWVIGPNKRVAIITLDGQTKAKNLLALLAKLDDRGARVTFFLSGTWIDHHQAKAEAVIAGGHALGNRGYGKAAFTDLDGAALSASIRKAGTAVAKVGGSAQPYLRAPKGRRDRRVLDVAGSLGYRSVRWTQYPGSGLASKISGRVVRNAQAGTIINLDVWRKSHRNALPKIIDGLRDRGFGLRTVDVLARTHAVRWDVTLSSGSSGSEVSYLQKTLQAITYPTGPVNGSFGYSTLQSVYAFEKVKRLARDGVVTPAQMAQIAVARRPRAPKRKPKNFVEIDIGRQVLFEVRDHRVVKTIPVASGNEQPYTYEGRTYRAHTPRGDFTIERKIPGKRVSHLGTLWWPSYFTGGFAIHGSDSVPTQPASHGCVRIPRYLEQRFYERTPVGIPVFVY